MAVARDTYVSGTTNGGTSIVTGSMTTGGGDRQLLCFIYLSSISSNVTSLTGASLTWELVARIDFITSGGIGLLYRAYASSTISGQTFTANVSGFPQAAMIVSAYSGVNTTKPIGDMTYNMGAGITTLSTSVTTEHANSLVVGFLGCPLATTITPDTNITEYVQVSSAGGFADASGFERDAVTSSAATSVSMGGTTGTSTSIAVFEVELLDAAETISEPYFVDVGPMNTGTGTTLTGTLPTGVAENDLMLAFVVSRRNGAPTWTFPAGWSQRASQFLEIGAADLALEMWYKIAGASEANFTGTISDGTNGWSLSVMNYRNLNTGTPFDFASSITGTAGDQQFYTMPTGTTNTNNAVCITVAATEDNNALLLVGTPSAFSGRAQGQDYNTATGSDHALGVADRYIPTAGTFAMNVWKQTTANNDSWVSIVDAIKPASGGGGGAVRRPSMLMMVGIG